MHEREQCRSVCDMRIGHNSYPYEHVYKKIVKLMGFSQLKGVFFIFDKGYDIPYVLKSSRISAKNNGKHCCDIYGASQTSSQNHHHRFPLVMRRTENLNEIGRASCRERVYVLV